MEGFEKRMARDWAERLILHEPYLGREYVYMLNLTDSAERGMKT